MSAPYHVIAFGSATVDTFLETQNERSEEIVENGVSKKFISFESGAKILVEEAHRTIGGGGTNVAACMARLGLNVAFGGCLGNDAAGDEVILWLQREGIDFVGSRVEAETNFSVILDSKTLHDRVILAYKDSADLLDLSDLNMDSLASTWFYFSSMMGESYETMIELMKHASYSGTAVAFNPSQYQAQQGLSALKDAIELSQLLVLNKTEAELILGYSGSRSELCLGLRSVGAEIVLITDGANGASLLYADTLYHGESQASLVVETTGAGDCFASSFLSGLDWGLSPQDALKLAFINVENLIQHVGPKQGLLDRDSAHNLLLKDHRSIISENA